MIFNISQIGSNIISFNYEIPITSNILAILRVPCYSGKDGQQKEAVILPYICESSITIPFQGVEEGDEDLLNGLIWFKNIGTWEADLYYQESDTNTDPNLATYLDTIQIQVNYG